MKNKLDIVDSTRIEYEKYMGLALNQARIAFDLGEVPVGAIVVCDGKVIGKGYNLRETNNDALGHAEILAISQASRELNSWRLVDCDLFVTLEPCPMCAGAVINSRVRRVIFGTCDPKSGACGSVIDLFAQPFNHTPIVVKGILQDECSDILKKFFQQLRNSKNV